MKKNLYYIVVFLLVVWSVLLLLIVSDAKDKRIYEAIKAEEKDINIRYEYIYSMYKMLAYNQFRYVVKSKDTMKILKKLKDIKKYNIDDTREELYKHLKDNYKYLKKMNFRQFHFHLKDNRSFLRMHRPEKYGDNLSGTRYGVEYVNKYLVPVDGFEEGRILNGLRFIFPIIDDEKDHLGSVEISIKSKAFLDSFEDSELYDLHFLVKKEVIDKKLFKDERKMFYEDSLESSLYYIEKETDINIKYNEKFVNFTDMRETIESKIKTEQKFYLFNNDVFLYFFPIKNIEGKVESYFVIYKNPKTIISIKQSFYFISIFIVIALLAVLYIIYKNKIYRDKDRKYHNEIKSQNKTLNAIVYILNNLVSSHDFDKSIHESFDMIIETLNIDRLYIFEKYQHNSEVVFSQRFESVNIGIEAFIDDDKLQNIAYDDERISIFIEALQNKKIFESLVKDLPKVQKDMLESQGIVSILIMPIYVEDKFWGFIGFDDCHNERIWNSFEKDILKVLSSAFVSALNKQKYSDNLQSQINTQLQELREKDSQLLQTLKQAQMGDMIGMIAHQWRQPLNAISASSINLSLLASMDMVDVKKIDESCDFIQAQCQKMSQTIDTFLNFVKPAQHKKSFKLTHMIDSIMNIMGTQLVNHNIEVNVDTKDENISLMGHEDLLEQVIINLLSNTRDAFDDIKKDDKFIKITIDKIDDIPIIKVQDNAGGISDDVKDKMFNPYFTTKEQGKGTGLGLYMSIDIMRKSFNGDLIHSNIDDGSLFEVICGEV